MATKGNFIVKSGLTVNSTATIGNGSAATSLYVYGNVSGSNNSYVRLTDTSGSSLGFAAVLGGTTTVNIEGGSGNSYLNGGGNLGIGTSSPGVKLDIAGTSNIRHTYTGASGGILFGQYNSTGDAQIQNQSTSGIIAFATNNTERMRIDTSGQLWKGYSTQIFTASAYQLGVSFAGSSSQGIVIKNTENNQSGAAIRFVDYLGNYTGGGIYFQTSGSVSYSASSDYRLKKDVQPITNGLSTITSLNPVTFNWKTNDTKGEGFIAHELAEYIPNAVIGDKDAVYEDGSVKSQVVDQSKIIVHLVAAVKELKTEIEQLKVELNALSA